jgi:hypothetical protein
VAAPARARACTTLRKGINSIEVSERARVRARETEIRLCGINCCGRTTAALITLMSGRVCLIGLLTCTMCFCSLPLSRGKLQAQLDRTGAMYSRTMLRCDLIEGLVRVAMLKYKESARPLPEAIRMLLDFCRQQASVPWPVTQDHNTFRHDQLYTEEVDNVRRGSSTAVGWKRSPPRLGFGKPPPRRQPQGSSKIAS